MAIYSEIIAAVNGTSCVSHEPSIIGSDLFFTAEDGATYKEIKDLADSIGGDVCFMSYREGNKRSLKWIGYATDLIRVIPSELGMDYGIYDPDLNNILADIRSIVEDGEDIEGVQAYIANEIELLEAHKRCSPNEQVVTLNGIYFDTMPIFTTSFEWDGRVCVIGISVNPDTICENELIDIADECLARAILEKEPFNILEKNIQNEYKNIPPTYKGVNLTRGYLYKRIKDMYESDIFTDNEIEYFKLRDEIL